MGKVIVLGIAGGTGSGKTLLAQSLIDLFNPQDVAILRMDDYYKDLPDGTDPLVYNFDHPNSIDMDKLIEDLNALKDWQEVDIPQYDYVVHKRIKGRTQQPAPILMLEGLWVLENSALRDVLDIKIYVDTAADIRLSRRIRRDVAERGRVLEGVITQYLNTVRPMHEAFVEPSKHYADIIVPHGGKNTVVHKALSDNLKMHMQQYHKERVL